MALAFCFWVVVWEGVRARMPNFTPKKNYFMERSGENNKEKYKLGDDHHNNNNNHHLDRTYHLQIAIRY
jgi:hypothetical protein